MEEPKPPPRTLPPVGKTSSQGSVRALPSQNSLSEVSRDLPNVSKKRSSAFRYVIHFDLNNQYRNDLIAIYTCCKSSITNIISTKDNIESDGLLHN